MIGKSSLSPGVRKVCSIRGDLSGMVESVEKNTNAEGKDYWRIHYSLVVSFGATALHAALHWEENVSST